MWFDVPTTQMSILVLFVSTGVFFDGAFSLWVSLKKLRIFVWETLKNYLRLVRCKDYWLNVKGFRQDTF